ncbi:DUF4345 family protein [Aquiflexum sp.]|uniref:DUF4345 family protein n=1 Tax=Aquiflexum sp. TaxID=1872584 RepID=UPI00359421F7
MKISSYFFFYTYIGLVVLAGFWGAFIYPSLDFELMFGLNLSQLQDFERINLLSQYRFLRALELGFGLFALIFVREVFSDFKFNRLFLTIMGLGILARMFSWIFDGKPSYLTMFFMFYELIGWIVIFTFSIAKIKRQ